MTEERLKQIEEYNFDLSQQDVHELLAEIRRLREALIVAHNKNTELKIDISKRVTSDAQFKFTPEDFAAIWTSSEAQKDAAMKANSKLKEWACDEGPIGVEYILVEQLREDLKKLRDMIDAAPTVYGDKFKDTNNCRHGWNCYEYPHFTHAAKLVCIEKISTHKPHSQSNEAGQTSDPTLKPTE